LADGPATQDSIKSKVEAAGFSWRTIQRAADDLGLDKFKSGMRGCWSWRMSADEGDHESPSTDEVASFDESEF
jgi:putative DNA primase/helicase